MSFVYSLFISIFNISLKLNSLFNEKTKKIVLGRKKTKDYIKNNIEDQKVIWIHVASVGEFEQAKPIIDSLKRNYQNKILVSYFSSSTEIAVSNYKNVDFHFYMLSDKEDQMKLLFDLLNPKILILIKYEFWRNLILQAKLNSIPIVSVSSVFRKNQVYFYPIKFFKNILKNISLFLVQDEKSMELLKKIKIKKVKVIGDSRYDRVLMIFQKSKEIDEIKEFTNKKNSIVIGSAWKSDIEKIKNEIIRDLTDTKYIIAPHNINSDEIEYLENTFINDTIKFSELPQKNVRKRILIIDNIGMLSSIYKYGKIAFIGGGFRGALHNTLEAAVWNLPVIYGNHKNNRKFIEVDRIEKEGIGFPIKNGNEFKLIKNRILKNRDIGRGGNEFIIKNSGATEKISYHLTKHLK
tara:strand:- start:3106 stop:4326 length:1221 start_codon:yes stop_codon:yes gene_type:complete